MPRSPRDSSKTKAASRTRRTGSSKDSARTAPARALPGSATRSELAAIRRTREFGSATRCCITSMTAAAGASFSALAAFMRRPSLASAVHSIRSGIAAAGMTSSRASACAVRPDLNFRVAQAFDQGGDGFFRDGRRIHPARRGHPANIAAGILETGGKSLGRFGRLDHGDRSHRLFSYAHFPGLGGAEQRCSGCRRGGAELAQGQCGIDLNPVAVILEQATAQAVDHLRRGAGQLGQNLGHLNLHLVIRVIKEKQHGADDRRACFAPLAHGLDRRRHVPADRGLVIPPGPTCVEAGVGSPIAPKARIAWLRTPPSSSRAAFSSDGRAAAAAPFILPSASAELRRTSAVRVTQRTDQGGDRAVGRIPIWPRASAAKALTQLSRSTSARTRPGTAMARGRLADLAQCFHGFGTDSVIAVGRRLDQCRGGLLGRRADGPKGFGRLGAHDIVPAAQPQREIGWSRRGRAVRPGQWPRPRLCAPSHPGPARAGRAPAPTAQPPFSEHPAPAPPPP